MKHTHYFTTAAVADNRGHDDDSDFVKDKAPLVKEQGSFAFGGTAHQLHVQTP